MGMVARNMHTYMDNYVDEWGKFIREVCLTIILAGGGMELTFKDKKIIILLLAIIPMLFEAAAVAEISYLTYSMPIML